MSGTFDMGDLRQRYDVVRLADQARTNLLDDLFQKLGDMRKVMDRNAFVVVLLDGDCTLFLDELIKKGISGGDEAAKLLRKATFDYLRYDDYFKHDYKIVVRLYANLRGLAHTYYEKGIIPNITVFTDFVLGFNKAHPLCDFIDAGNHKEAADSKLKENLNLYVYNVHCKQIVFGASADNAYASYLSSFLIDTEISSRIRLLKSQPFAKEFTNILPKLKWTEFPTIFRSQPIMNIPVYRFGSANNYAQERARSTRNIESDLWQLQMGDAGDGSVVDTTRAATTEAPQGPSSHSQRKMRLHRDEDDSDSDHKGATLITSNTTQTNWTTTRPDGSMISVEDIKQALIGHTNKRLSLGARGLDFGAVKRDVEAELGLSPEFWGTSERDIWFLKSKDILKKAVEDWVERTGNPPPGNATWLRSKFPNDFPPRAARTSPSPQQSEEDNPPEPTSTSPLECLRTGYGLNRIFHNGAGQRIDVPIKQPASPTALNALRFRQPRLCNMHYLAGKCTNHPCGYEHEALLSNDEFRALLQLSRSQPCPRGSFCDDLDCTRGHVCPSEGICKHGDQCRFARLHGIDRTIVD